MKVYCHIENVLLLILKKVKVLLGWFTKNGVLGVLIYIVQNLSGSLDKAGS